MTNTEGKAKSSVIILHTLVVSGPTKLHPSKSSTREVIWHFFTSRQAWVVCHLVSRWFWFWFQICNKKTMKVFRDYVSEFSRHSLWTRFSGFGFWTLKFFGSSFINFEFWILNLLGFGITVFTRLEENNKICFPKAFDLYYLKWSDGNKSLSYLFAFNPDHSQVTSEMFCKTTRGLILRISRQHTGFHLCMFQHTRSCRGLLWICSLSLRLVHRPAIFCCCIQVS